MTIRAGSLPALVALLLLLPFAGCSGDDGSARDDAEKAAEAEKAVAGTFVGQVAGTKAFVAVIAAPAGDQDSRAVQVYVSDGRRVSGSFSGSISDNSFVATAEDGESEARGELSADSVTGTVELPDGTSAKYKAASPSGPAGLYDLTVSRAGELNGVSSAGLGVSGEIERVRRGTGELRLVDGRRLTFEIVRKAGDDVIRLRAGQVRLIVLPGGKLTGAGKSPRAAGGLDSAFFVRSASA